MEIAMVYIHVQMIKLLGSVEGDQSIGVKLKKIDIWFGNPEAGVLGSKPGSDITITSIQVR